MSMEVKGGDTLDDSILATIKKMLGLSADYPPFDTDIIVHINTYLAVLNQLGVGVDRFSIVDGNATWGDFLSGQDINLNEVKTYLYLRVRLVFDPPTSSILAQAIDNNVNELTWRLLEEVDYAEAKKETSS